MGVNYQDGLDIKSINSWVYYLKKSFQYLNNNFQFFQYFIIEKLYQIIY